MLDVLLDKLRVGIFFSSNIHDKSHRERPVVLSDEEMSIIIHSEM